MVEKRTLTDLKRLPYTGEVRPVRRKQRITDEDLLEIFETIIGKWFDVEVLARSVGNLVPVNDSNPKRSAFSSSYLKRLSKITGQRWRQKSGLGDGGKRLVKIYTDKTRR